MNTSVKEAKRYNYGLGLPGPAVIDELPYGTIRIQWGVLSRYVDQEYLETNQTKIEHDFYREALTLEGDARQVHLLSLGWFSGRLVYTASKSSVDYVVFPEYLGEPKHHTAFLKKYFTHIGDVWAAYVPETNTLYVNAERERV